MASEEAAIKEESEMPAVWQKHEIGAEEGFRLLGVVSDLNEIIWKHHHVLYVDKCSS